MATVTTAVPGPQPLPGLQQGLCRKHAGCCGLCWAQWVTREGLIPHRAPACTAQGAGPGTSVDSGEQPYPLPALVASDTRFGVVFLKTEFIRKDESVPICQVAVSPLAPLRGFALNLLPHAAPMAGGASLNCPPEPWGAKALLQPLVWCGCGRIRSSTGPDPALSPPCPPGKERGLRSPPEQELNKRM